MAVEIVIIMADYYSKSVVIYETMGVAFQTEVRQKQLFIFSHPPSIMPAAMAVDQASKH